MPGPCIDVIVQPVHRRLRVEVIGGSQHHGLVLKSMRSAVASKRKKDSRTPLGWLDDVVTVRPKLLTGTPTNERASSINPGDRPKI